MSRYFFLFPFIGIFFLSACSQETPTIKQAKPIIVSTQELHPSTETLWIDLSGVTTAPQEVSIRSKTPGFIKKIHFQEGEFVQKGDLLIRLDDGVQQSELALAKAKYQQARVALSLAEQNYYRAKKLIQEKAISHEQWDVFQARFSQAKALIQESEANLKHAKELLSYTKIVAPTDGFITKAQFKEGDFLQDKNRIVSRITQKNPLFVEFSPADRILQGVSLSLESQVRVYTNTNEKYLLAKLNYISPEQNPRNGTRTLRAQITEKHSLLPGEFVRVRLEKETIQNAYRIPQKAVLQLPNGRYQVFILKNGLADARIISVTQWDGTDWIVRMKNLQEGRLLITDQLIKLRDQLPVKQKSAEVPS